MSRTWLVASINTYRGLDEIVNELAKGNRLEFRDFGVFETKFRGAREAQNPKTLEKVLPSRGGEYSIVDWEPVNSTIFRAISLIV